MHRRQETWTRWLYFSRLWQLARSRHNNKIFMQCSSQIYLKKWWTDFDNNSSPSDVTHSNSSENHEIECGIFLYWWGNMEHYFFNVWRWTASVQTRNKEMGIQKNPAAAVQAKSSQNGCLMSILKVHKLYVTKKDLQQWSGTICLCFFKDSATNFIKVACYHICHLSIKRLWKW